MKKKLSYFEHLIHSLHHLLETKELDQVSVLCSDLGYRMKKSSD